MKWRIEKSKHENNIYWATPCQYFSFRKILIMFSGLQEIYLFSSHSTGLSDGTKSSSSTEVEKLTRKIDELEERLKENNSKHKVDIAEAKKEAKGEDNNIL